MNRARSFFFVCLGILALALAYHFGATTATAQAPGNPLVVGWNNNGYGDYAATANGDVYFTTDAGWTWTRRGNVFGSATPVQSISIGQLKAKYAR